MQDDTVCEKCPLPNKTRPFPVFLVQLQECRVTRALAITQRQAQTLLRAAEAERGIVEVEIGATVFRLIPECRAEPVKSQGGRYEIRL